MQITEQLFEDVAVIELQGKFLGGTECTEVYKRTKELIEKGINKVVVDLDQVTLMNSSGLGALVGSLISLRKADGTLKLSSVKDRMSGLLMAADIISLFEIHATIAEAVAAFRSTD